jgi:anti-sigma-K factor RskA
VDVQRYISSGIIENHIAGLLSAAESREVDASIQQYPEVKAVADAVQKDMEDYIQLWSKKPPAGVKRQLLERLKTAETEETVAETPETEEEISNDTFSENTGLRISPLQIWQYSAVAAILLLLVSVTLYVMANSEASTYKSKNATLENEEAALIAEKDALKEQLDHVRKEADLMKDPAFKWIKMLAVGKHTGVVATICWNPQSKETFILAQALPEPPGDKQYQLWAIVNGKPVDAGVFELGDKAHAMQKVKAVENAQVFAVTLEKKGGNPTPSLDQMLVAGKVAG